MTRRKPADVPVPNWVDQLIQEAQARGEFDNLRGAGKPLPGIDEPLDEDWWVKQKIREEELPTDGLLPPALQLRKELAALPENVRHLRDEQAVRAAVREVNARVAEFIRAPTGPVLPVAPASPDAVVASWREQREDATDAPEGAGHDDAAAGGADPAPTSRRRWWWPWSRRRS